MNQRNTVNTTLVILFFAIIGIIVLYVTTSKQQFGERPSRSFSELGGDFTLQSDKGSVSLNDLRGKAVVLYFGFMTCPDVCPNSLNVIKQAFNKLSSDQLEEVKGIMISIDPKRDSLADLQAFTQYFHPNIIGLTGNQQQLDEVAKQYAAYFASVKDQNNEYLFEHSSRYYVIDKNGILIDAMRHSTTSNELAARLKTVI